MKQKNFIAIVISIFIFAAAFVQLADAQNRADIAKAERISGDKFSVSLRTPRGANIFAVKRPSKAMLAAIDKGLADLFVIARKNGYTRRLRYSDYSIFIARADRVNDSSGRYSPGIAVGAAQYAGTDYDQGGYIYAAGMVIGYNPGAFVMAEHSRDFSSVSNVVRFEGEHIVLYNNDRKRYRETADHSKGGGHPILQ